MQRITENNTFSDTCGLADIFGAHGAVNSNSLQLLADFRFGNAAEIPKTEQKIRRVVHNQYRYIFISEIR
jgi:hypothetical protein